MAERKYFAIVTDKGNAKIAQAVATGQKLNITTFVAGDGNGEYYIPTSDMVAIKNEVWRGTISKADVVQDAQKILRVTTVIPADVTGFVVRELGLLDDTGELIAIGNSVDLPKVSLQDGFSVELELSMRIAVKNTEVFSFTIDPHMVIMTKDMLDTHNVDSNAHEELFEGKADKTGNVATATKLQTARTITLSGDVTGNTTFDGAANKTITTALKNSGVAAGTYGADLIKLAVSTWISNNRGLHSTTATSTWTAKQDMTMSFRYTVSSESVSYDYLNITAAGTQILANTGGTATTNTLTATLKTGQTIVFNYRKDGSGNTNEDCAKISEVKVTPTGSTSATTVTTANFASYFTATNSTYGFLPLIELQKKSTSGGSGTNGFTLPCVTVDAKGRVTAATEVFIMPAEGGGNIPLTIAEGGTGATTASVALSNLGGFPSAGGTINGNVKIIGSVSEGNGTTNAAYSHAEGYNTTTNSMNSHAEGDTSITNGVSSHAEGVATQTYGWSSHAEGRQTTAIDSDCHAEGHGSIALLQSSHAEGDATIAAMNSSHAEGDATKTAYNNILKISKMDSSTKTIFFDTDFFTHNNAFNKLKVGSIIYIRWNGYNRDNKAHKLTIASKNTSNNTVTVNEDITSYATSGSITFTGYAVLTGSTSAIIGAHAEGSNTLACNRYAHAEGSSTIASGESSHAGGYRTRASGKYQTAIGIYNKESTAETDKLIIGNGTSDTARSNCLRVTNTNGVYSNSTYKSSGADYAEMFEWLDRNVENEDRKGLFVTLDGDKICTATPQDDYILGIVSACPSVCGDVNDDTWGNMYLTTIWGTPILEEVEIPERTEEIKTINENGEEITKTIVTEEAHTEIRQKLNPEYDNTQKYIPRSERPEWAAVGMLGKLVAIDDGSCEKNGWCTVGNGGVATKSEKRTKFRVMSRLDENHIKVLIL